MELRPLPSQGEDEKREDDLKAAFAGLERDHDEIEKLFKRVAEQLVTMPKIGAEHELTKEWNKLSKKHHKLYRDSQRNADKCASFLEDYTGVLVPLTEGLMTTEEQKSVITKFKESIPKHQADAENISDDFLYLKREVELFPDKITGVLKQDRSWIQAMRDGAEWLFTTIWNSLQALFKAIVRAFQSMLDGVGKMRFTCGPFISHIDIEVSTSLPPHPRYTSGSMREVNAECEEIGQELTGFIGAWHRIDVACNTLLSEVELFNKLSGMPGAFSAYLKKTQNQILTVYYPLIRCLRAYALGSSASKTA